jgi:hypothetical protein
MYGCGAPIRIPKATITGVVCTIWIIDNSSCTALGNELTARRKLILG